MLTAVTAVTQTPANEDERWGAAICGFPLLGEISSEERPEPLEPGVLYRIDRAGHRPRSLPRIAIMDSGGAHELHPGLPPRHSRIARRVETAPGIGMFSDPTGAEVSKEAYIIASAVDRAVRPATQLLRMQLRSESRSRFRPAQRTRLHGHARRPDGLDLQGLPQGGAGTRKRKPTSCPATPMTRAANRFLLSVILPKIDR